MRGEKWRFDGLIFAMCFVFSNFLGSYVQYLMCVLGIPHGGAVSSLHQYHMGGAGWIAKELIQFR